MEERFGHDFSTVRVHTDVKDKGYPTLHPEDNAYSHDHYAVDIAAGTKAPDTLKKRDPKAPKAKL